MTQPYGIFEHLPEREALQRTLVSLEAKRDRLQSTMVRESWPPTVDKYKREISALSDRIKRIHAELGD